MQYDLHEIGLALSQHLHLRESLLVHRDLAIFNLFRWCSEAMDYAISVLVFPLLQVPLHLLRIERLQRIWLVLEPLVELRDVLNVVLNCL